MPMFISDRIKRYKNILRKNYNIYQEVFKLPYNVNLENNDNKILTENFCSYTIKIRKKIIKGIK